MPYGLTDREFAKIEELFSQDEKIEYVLLRGSRARGNYRPDSDMDITILGRHIDQMSVEDLQKRIENSDISCPVEIFPARLSENEEYIEGVSHKGLLIYQKPQSK